VLLINIMANILLAAALEYAKRGWFVFPVHGIDAAGQCTCGIECDTPGKHPRTNNGVKDASADADQIRAWWTKWPDANVAVATGSASNLVVLDLDIKPGKDGRAALRVLEAQHGPLPTTPKVETGSGGEHLYFSHPGGLVANSVGLVAPGIDVRADGGYVVAPPSLHLSGREYGWVRAPTTPLTPPASWAYSIARPRTIPVASAELPPAIPSVLMAARAALADHGPAIEGQGGDKHTFRAGAILLHDFALTWDEAWPLALEWNATCQPPWDEDALTTKLENAVRHAGVEAYGDRRRTAEWLQRWDAGESPAADPKDPFQVAFVQAIAQLRAYGLGDTTKNAGPKHDAFESLASLLTRDFPATPWLLRGLLVEKGVMVVSGEPKTTKTWAALEMSIAIASETSAFDEFPAVHTGLVVYFAAEDSSVSFRNRARALATRRTETPAATLANVFVKTRKALNLQSDRELAWLIAECRLLPTRPVLLVIDPLRDVHTTDENDSAAMADVMRRLRALRDLLDCAVLFVHHSAKATKDSNGRRPGQKMRGSSAIHGAVDGGMYLMGLETDNQTYWSNDVQIEIKAARGAGGFNLKLEITDNADGEAVAAKWTVSRVDDKKDENEIVEVAILNYLDKRREPISRGLLARKLGKRNATVASVLEDLKDRGVVEDVVEGRKVLGIVLVPPKC
jgi:hypothetical protein